MDAINKQQYVSPHRLIAHFWDMFIADALLSNTTGITATGVFFYDELKSEAESTSVFLIAGAACRGRVTES